MFGLRERFEQQTAKDAEAFADKMKYFLRSDKSHEVAFKQTINEITQDILSIVANDHGLINFLLDLYA